MESLSPQQMLKMFVFAFLSLVLLVFGFGCYEIVQPGMRGIIITLGRVHDQFAPEGLLLKAPLITQVKQVSVRQITRNFKSECYSSDLQQVNIDVKVLLRVPENSVISIFKEYSGDPFESLVTPRIHEALKEITASQNAESIVKKREAIKSQTLELARGKIGDILEIQDIVIENITLSEQLERAIEEKMVQEQEAAKAKFTQQKTEIESKTAVIRAQGEAEAIRIKSQALKESPALIHLQIVEKWDGKAPLVVGSPQGGGSNIILPLGPIK